jgi:hypothetical protein
MYIKIVLWIEGDDDGPIVINTTTQSVPRLLGSNDMTKLYENFTMSITCNYGTG